jgi:predicted amidophosphoribosyltransferase
MEFETFVVIVAVAVIFVIATIRSNRRAAFRAGQRTCPACGAVHPGIARFCRRCGQKLTF